MNLLGKCISTIDKNEVNKTNEQDYTLLHFACLESNLKAAKLLLDNAGNTEVKTIFEKTPLSIAVNFGNFELVSLLLNYGANVNNHTETPLLIDALHGEYLDIVFLLIDKGININSLDNRKRTALMYASIHGQLEIVKLLLNKGAEISYLDVFGNTAMILAEENGSTDIVNLLSVYESEGI